MANQLSPPTSQYSAVLGTSHPSYAAARHNLGHCLLALADAEQDADARASLLDRAEAEFDGALAVRQAERCRAPTHARRAKASLADFALHTRKPQSRRPTDSAARSSSTGTALLSPQRK